MFEFGYQIIYFNNNKWQKLFVKDINNLQTLGIDKNKVSKMVKTFRLKKQNMAIDNQIMLLNKIRGLIASGTNINTNLYNLIDDYPELKKTIPISLNAKISDFLEYALFYKEIVIITKLSELVGNINNGLDAAYSYLIIKKNSDKNIKKTISSHILVFFAVLLMLFLAPAYFANTLIKLQADIPLEINQMTNVLFFIANYNVYIISLIIFVATIFIFSKDYIITTLANIPPISTLNTYYKSKEAITFMLTFRLLYAENLDFVAILKNIAAQNKSTTIKNISAKIAKGISLSQAVKESDYPKWFKSSFIGFEKNTSKAIQLETLDKLIEVLIEQVNNINDKFINTIKGLVQLMILLTVALIVTGFILPIMSASKNIL